MRLLTIVMLVLSFTVITIANTLAKTAIEGTYIRALDEYETERTNTKNIEH